MEEAQLIDVREPDEVYASIILNSNWFLEYMEYMLLLLHFVNIGKH